MSNGAVGNGQKDTQNFLDRVRRARIILDVPIRVFHCVCGLALDLALSFPSLFREAVWGSTHAQFSYSSTIPPESLISNVNIVPHAHGRFIIARLANGEYILPGGTLEPGEYYMDAVRRELMEEIGAVLRSYRVLGHWRCRSTKEYPYRPHLPHPESYRLVLAGDVELVGRPTNPIGGEQVETVEVVTVVEAANRITAIGLEDLADLYRLAAATTEKGGRDMQR